MSPYPKDILNDIDSAIPFEKKRVAEKYKDIPVKWKVSFYSLRENGDNVVILSLLDYDHQYPWIYATADLNLYPQFKILKQKTVFNVSGKIESVDGPHQIHLKDTVFHFEEIGPSEKTGAPTSEVHTFTINNSAVHFGNGNNNNSINDKKAVLSKESWYETWWGKIVLAVIAAGIIYWFRWN